MTIKRTPVGRNQIWWLEDGPGAHGEFPTAVEVVEGSLVGGFRFAESIDGAPGLRAPQLGALHAILAHKSLETDDPVTIVLPTGTGKTETMLAAYCHEPRRTLVVVPSDSLRTQIGEKFATLGILPEVGAITGTFLTPVVGILKSGLDSVEECNELFARSNVVVATSAALSKCASEVMARIVELTPQLFVDEAHHVAAKTWQSISESFSGRTIVQFTATPFREDGQYLSGRIGYAYPLRLAQQNGFFANIDYTSITALGNADRTVADAAIARLRADREAGLDHVLMARVQTIKRAEVVLKIYAEAAPDLKPVRIDSKMSMTRQKAALAELQARNSLVVVCVDMLGEGFDLPALKIAAIHDPHKSLAVTLQFIGRFTRVGGVELGDASVFLPRQLGEIDDRLRRLYGEDSDWNSVIRDLTYAEVEQEKARNDFEAGFGNLPAEVALRSLQPKMSTVVFRSEAIQWNPNGVYEIFEEGGLLTKQIAVNESERVVWFVTAEHTPVRWGDFKTFAEVTHHLYIVHCDVNNGLIFINSSDNDGVHEALAKAVGGEDAMLIRGDVVYRVLSQIQRRIPTNIGLLDAVNRNRRFSMLVGANVLDGFGPTAAQKSKTNIFAHGYANKAHVSYGASRKGRIWSHKVAHSILGWVEWARNVGSIVIDESIDLTTVMSGFIIPKAAVERPDLVPLGIEWPHTISSTISEGRQIRLAGVPHALIDVDLVVTNWTTEGPIEFSAVTDSWSVPYRMTFNENGPRVDSVDIDAEVLLPSGPIPLSDFMTEKGLTVYFEQEALLSPDGYLIQPDRTRPQFPAQSLEALDWTGINIRKESQGPGRDADSVQYRVAEVIAAEVEWELIIDDDGSGEAADLVCLRRDEGKLYLTLVHCKYSSEDQPGARLADLYEVCGQAAKCHKARSEVEVILRKLIRREQRRRERGETGILVGTEVELLSILDNARLLDTQVTVIVAQPGLSKDQVSHQQAELLACTQLYLSETYGSAFRVLCST